MCVFACEGPEVDSDTRVVPFHQAGNMGEPTLLPGHTANGMTLQNPPTKFAVLRYDDFDSTSGSEDGAMVDS